jgi:hypothetical protein
MDQSAAIIAAPGRRDFKPHPVGVVSAVLAQCALCQARMLTTERP